jgi:hypothetical protein
MMRTNPDYARLRIVAIVCWSLSGWWIVQMIHIEPVTSISILPFAKFIASVLVLAVGIAFWQLATDKRAGIIVDKKGMMLNLGHYAAFVAWDNLVELGKSQHRDSVLALGSPRQLGIRLDDADTFLQSYEERMPASTGLLGTALRFLERTIRHWHHNPSGLTPEHLAHTRSVSGYDILIPEAILGQKVDVFINTIEQYRRYPQRSITQKFPAFSMSTGASLSSSSR